MLLRFTTIILIFTCGRLHAAEDLLIEDLAPGDNVFSSIVNAFEDFCEDQRPQDDVTLVNVPCSLVALQIPRSLQDAIHE